MFARRSSTTRPTDALDREVVQWREVAEAVLRDPDRLGPRPNTSGRADHESLEPRLRDIAEPFGRRLVEKPA